MPATETNASHLDDAVLENLPRRLQLCARKEWTPGLQNSKIIFSKLSAAESEPLRADQAAFIEDIQKLISWDFLPENPADWIYANEQGDQELRWSAKDFKVHARRWDVAIHFRKKKEVDEAKLGQLHEELSKLLLFKFEDVDGNDLPPVTVEKFTRFVPEVAAVYRARGAPLGARFAEVSAFSNGKLILISLVPELLYKPESEWKGRSSKVMLDMLKKQRGG